MRVDRTRGVQQPSKLKIAEFDSPYPLQVCLGNSYTGTTLNSTRKPEDVERCQEEWGYHGFKRHLDYLTFRVATDSATRTMRSGVATTGGPSLT